MYGSIVRQADNFTSGMQSGLSVFDAFIIRYRMKSLHNYRYPRKNII